MDASIDLNVKMFFLCHEAIAAVILKERVYLCLWSFVLNTKD